MKIRPATLADAPAFQQVYAWNVENGVGTFEEIPPSIDEMGARMAAVAGRGLPWLIAEAGGKVLGYAYAAPFRLRAAYRYTAEDSIYLAPDAVGRGVGKALLSEVVAACEAIGIRQLLAVIGGSDNVASIGVHRACGFETIGTSPGLGFKFGAFVDVVFMQKALNGGAEGVPDVPGLNLRGV
jgi:L-amino acid N-acyltransferase YncA